MLSRAPKAWVLLLTVNAWLFSVDAHASFLDLPAPGTQLAPSPPVVPLVLKGLILHPQDPLKIDFIVDSGQRSYTREAVAARTRQLTKYFLAALTIPNPNLWVNLSPYEQERVVPQVLGETALGRDMLAQDYLLKQLTASLTDPRQALGKIFWARVYMRLHKQFGEATIPINTFNKVWILPDDAAVAQEGNAVFITHATLKVMMDQDYQALRHRGVYVSGPTDTRALTSSVLRDVILPEICKEINAGENFSTLRQIYYSLILAKWYKGTIRANVISDSFEDKEKIRGLHIDPRVKQAIYRQYVQAYKKGVFDFIKEDFEYGHSAVHKYFSGGLQIMPRLLKYTAGLPAQLPVSGTLFLAPVRLLPLTNRAMTAEPAAKSLLLDTVIALPEHGGYFDLSSKIHPVVAFADLARRRLPAESAQAKQLDGAIALLQTLPQRLNEQGAVIWQFLRQTQGQWSPERIAELDRYYEGYLQILHKAMTILKNLKQEVESLQNTPGLSAKRYGLLTYAIGRAKSVLTNLIVLMEPDDPKAAVMNLQSVFGENPRFKQFEPKINGNQTVDYPIVIGGAAQNLKANINPSLIHAAIGRWLENSHTQVHVQLEQMQSGNAIVLTNAISSEDVSKVQALLAYTTIIDKTGIPRRVQRIFVLEPQRERMHEGGVGSSFIYHAVHKYGGNVFADIVFDSRMQPFIRLHLTFPDPAMHSVQAQNGGIDLNGIQVQKSRVLRIAQGKFSAGLGHSVGGFNVLVLRVTPLDAQSLKALADGRP